MLLSEARAKVQQLLDDVAGQRFTTANINEALALGQAEAWQLAVGSGTSRFTITGIFTTSTSGVLDMTSQRPQRITSVAFAPLGSPSRTFLRPARVIDAVEAKAQQQRLEIAYVPDVTFPAADGDPFVWGSASVVCKQIDHLTCYIAATDLNVKEAAANAPLLRRRAELADAVASLLETPGVAVTPVSALYDHRDWAYGCEYAFRDPYQLSLVYT